MRHMPTVIKKTPEGRDVIRFRFEGDEVTPAIRKPVITREARALVCEALGLSDSGSLVLGELAEDFHDCPSGSACGRYLGSEGTVLHVVGAGALVTDRTDPDFVDDATGEPARDLDGSIDDADTRARYDGEDVVALDELAELRAELATMRAQLDAANERADEAMRERDALRNIAKSNAKKASARGAKK